MDKILKKETKVSIICDSDKNIHSIIVVPTHKKTQIKNTLMSDDVSIEINVKNLLKTNLRSKKGLPVLLFMILKVTHLCTI